jgi:hypothetical protein
MVGVKRGGGGSSRNRERHRTPTSQPSRSTRTRDGIAREAKVPISMIGCV